MSLFGFGRLLVFVALAIVLPLHATTIPALQPAPVPNVPIFDDASQPASFRTSLNQAGSGPVILLPIFTRCSASCPVLTRKLEAALSGIKSAEPYRVVVFSFDPLETAESLRFFRTHEHIPADWKIVRANESEIRSFFGFFRYTVMNQDGTLIHPNEIFLLDDALNWRWTLVGEDWSREELATAISQTRSPGFSSRIRAHPEMLAWTGFAAAVLSLGIAIGWMIWRKPSFA